IEAAVLDDDVETGEFDLPVRERQACVEQRSSAARRNRISQRAEGMAQAHGDVLVTTASEGFQVAAQIVLVELELAARHAFRHLHPEEGVEVPSPQHDVPIVRQSGKESLRRLAEMQ